MPVQETGRYDKLRLSSLPESVHTTILGSVMKAPGLAQVQSW